MKFDFLGLKTLTVIAKAEELFKQRGISLVNTQNIDFEDKPSFEMLAKGDSVGVFQLEGAGMRDLLRKMKSPTTSTIWRRWWRFIARGRWNRSPKYVACKRGKEQAGVSASHDGADPARDRLA